MNATLILLIPGKRQEFYRLERLEASRECLSRWKLVKLDAKGSVHVVTSTKLGRTCDCEDATYRRRRCKHIAAMEEVLLQKGNVSLPKAKVS